MTMTSQGTVADLFRTAAESAAEYRCGLADRPVARPVDPATLRAALGGPLPAGPTAPDRVLDELVAAAEPGLVATAGPAVLRVRHRRRAAGGDAADMLAAGWDQLAFNAVTSPAAAVAEEVAGGWLKELLGLPATASVGFVTGAQAANTVGLAAGPAPRARRAPAGTSSATACRARRGCGWSPARSGTPPSTGRCGCSASATRSSSRSPPTANGAIDVDDLARGARPPSRTGRRSSACRPATSTPAPATTCGRRSSSPDGTARWVHVDGAFGLWAAASPATAAPGRRDRAGRLVGHATRTSGSTSPTTAASCSARTRRRTPPPMSYTAAYLVGSGAVRAPSDFVPESSRRARGFAVWAALRELGADGVAELVDRCCALARRFADGLAGRRRRGRQRRRAQPGAGRLRRRRPHRRDQQYERLRSSTSSGCSSRRFASADRGFEARHHRRVPRLQRQHVELSKDREVRRSFNLVTCRVGLPSLSRVLARRDEIAANPDVAVSRPHRGRG